ncbi:Wzz/FepE/Etk N-terminal domain-containing protein [Granulicella sp. S190]|uniref:GumC family protein n=1 Tax=Granulicella sp. S190 TaxID=1747226 RepID=UPI00131E0B8D|nr:Wzz/FepE/Etk N-terminal domain-containing protein [Granulicella sp. S190]
MTSYIYEPNAADTQALHPTVTDSRIDLLAVLLVLAKTKRRVMLMTVGGLAVGIILSLVLKPTFTATAAIIPPQQATSAASALLGQVGSLSGGGGLGGGMFGLKSPADMYVGILESRTIADNVIAACNLRQRYKTKTLTDAEAALQRHTVFESGKDNLIHLNVKDSDPKVASDIANSYLDQLYVVNSELATGEATQRVRFYERRIAEEKHALSDAEEALRNTQQKTGVIQFNGQAASIINAIAQARAELSSRQVVLQSMETYATEENPVVIQLQREIAALRSHVTELEKSEQTVQPGELQIPAGQLPEAALQYERQARELKYHETLFDLLTRQSEAAKLDEAKSVPILQIVDRAIPPDKKSAPSRKLLSLGFAAFGFLLAVTWGLVELFLDRLRRVPEQAQKLDEIRSALGFR